MNEDVTCSRMLTIGGYITKLKKGIKNNNNNKIKTVHRLLLLLLVGLVAIARLSGKYESLMWVMHLNSEELNHFCKSCLHLKVKCNIGC
jgi:hypothetical protein